MTTVKMPQLGETVIEGTILKWLKKEGEAIGRDEPLFEISTDKVDTEVPSPVDGHACRRSWSRRAQTVSVGTNLAEIDRGRVPAASRRPSPPSGAPAAEPARRRRGRGGRDGRRRSAEAGGGGRPWAGSRDAGRGAGHGQRRRGDRREATSPRAGRDRRRIGGGCPTVGLGRGSCRPSSGGSPRSTASTSRRSGHRDRWPHHQERHPRGDRSGGAAAAPAAPAAPAAAAAPAEVAPAPARARPAGPAPTVARGQPADPGPGEEVVPISHIRKAIAKHMVGLAPDHGPRLDDGRGQHGPSREAPGPGQGCVQGQARRQPHLPARSSSGPRATRCSRTRT